MTLDGGAITELEADPGSDSGAWMAVDATHVYWTRYGSSKGPTGAVMQVPIAGRAAVALALDQIQPYGLAVDDQAAYWIASDSVMKAGLDGGTPAVVAGGPGILTAIALDAGGIYLTTASASAGAGAVMRVDKSGGAVSTLASGQALPDAVVVDEESIYWVNEGEKGFGTGSIMRIAKGGGDPVVLASKQAPIGGVLAVGATCVYWANGTTSSSDIGTIVTVAK